MTPRETTLHRTALLESALHYVRQGWPVFPLHSIEDGHCSCGRACGRDAGKHPRTPHGLLDATRDSNQIRAWWAKWPDANLGVPTGTRTFVVLDVDPEKGGTESLIALVCQHGALPETVEAITGGGGRHLLFAHPGPGVRIPNSTSALGPGLDVRGDGGYIVVSPARHRSGRLYEWEAAHHPDDVPLAEAPAWLLARLQPTNGNGAGTAPPIDEIIGEGRRNQLLCSLAGSMRRRGLTAEEIFAALSAVNARRCRPPLAEAELRTIAASVGRYAPATETDLAAEPDPPVPVIPWRTMVADPPVPIAYHWPQWVALATVAVLAGAGDSLKSWLCLYLAAMTAAGRPAFAELGPDEPPLPCGPVVYLTAENAIDEEKRRCRLLKAGLGLPDDLPIYFVPAESLSLDREADYQRVVTLVEHLHPVALFIDSAIALSGLENENDNAAVRRFMKTRILPFSRTHRLTVYLVQHSPKPSLQPGQRMTDEHVTRGASDWRNSADAVLYLRRDPSLGELAVVLRCAKQRVGPRHRPIWFRLEDVEPGTAVRLVYGGAYSEDAQGVQAGVQKAVAAVVAILKATPSGVYQRELGEQVLAGGVSKATYRRALDVVRGKKPWLHGPLRGKTQAVVVEDRVGKQVFFVLDVAAWPSDEDWDDA